MSTSTNGEVFRAHNYVVQQTNLNSGIEERKYEVATQRSTTTPTVIQ